MRRTVTIAVVVAMIVGIMVLGTGCTSQPAANQAKQNIDQTTNAQNKQIADAINQVQAQVKDAAKQADVWGARVTGFQVKRELQQLQNDLQNANSAQGANQKQLVQAVADKFGTLLTTVKQAAASAPAGSPQKAGLDQLVTTLETGQKTLADALAATP